MVLTNCLVHPYCFVTLEVSGNFWTNHSSDWTQTLRRSVTWKCFPHYRSFVRGNHWSVVDFYHKGQWVHLLWGSSNVINFWLYCWKSLTFIGLPLTSLSWLSSNLIDAFSTSMGLARMEWLALLIPASDWLPPYYTSCGALIAKVVIPVKLPSSKCHKAWSGSQLTFFVKGPRHSCEILRVPCKFWRVPPYTFKTFYVWPTYIYKSSLLLSQYSSLQNNFILFCGTFGPESYKILVD